MLLLPAALVIWPPFVLCCSTLFGLGLGIFVPFLRTFDENYNIFCGGVTDVYKDSIKFIKDFWHFCYHSYFDYLFKIRTDICE
jgi:hypothetical protein